MHFNLCANQYNSCVNEGEKLSANACCKNYAEAYKKRVACVA